MSFPKYDPKKNYCTMSPDVILGVVINFGCFLHDRQYRNEVVERKIRKEADLQLRDCIYRDLKKSNVEFQIRIPKKLSKLFLMKDNLIFESKNLRLIKLRKKSAFILSRIYYYAVRYFAFFFWKG